MTTFPGNSGGTRHCSQVFQELPRCPFVSFIQLLGDRELARVGDADEQIELAFSGLHLGNIDVEEADRIMLEALPLRFVALDVRQARRAVSLEVAVQHRPG